jgi:hypothetical protein
VKSGAVLRPRLRLLDYDPMPAISSFHDRRRQFQTLSPAFARAAKKKFLVCEVNMKSKGFFVIDSNFLFRAVRDPGPLSPKLTPPIL